FLDMNTGKRFQQVELSTIDTALLLAGVLTCQSYFDGTDAVETEIRQLADSIYRRTDWQWAAPRAPLVALGWHPENGFLPAGWRGYSDRIWGLTASDGPGDLTLTIDGRSRQFHSYWARGASFTENPDDGTIAPTAAGGSIPFAPEIAIPALYAMRQTYGDNLFSTYGFRDAFNPTFTQTC